MAAFKVLIPLDGSRLAETSLAYLSPLKLLGELEVNLISVVDETRLKLPGDDDTREYQLLETYSNSVADRIHSKLSVPVNVQVIGGLPWLAIVQTAAAIAPDLLLITTHGRSGIERWRLGSVADKVIRGAECSVLAIGPQLLGRVDWTESGVLTSIRRVLIPLDGSVLAEVAIPAAERIAKATGAELHFVRVVPIPIFPDAATTNTGDVIQVLLDGSAEYLRTITKRPGFEAAKIQTALGYASDVLRTYVTENGIDLTVMTSHGRGGLVRTALGSVTDRMIGTSAPVLIVRPNEASHKAEPQSGQVE